MNPPLQVIDDPQSDSLLLVMEHVQGGSLEQPALAPPPHPRWAPLPEPAILRAVHEICQVCSVSAGISIRYSAFQPPQCQRVPPVDRLSDYS